MKTLSRLISFWVVWIENKASALDPRHYAQQSHLIWSLQLTCCCSHVYLRPHLKWRKHICRTNWRLGLHRDSCLERICSKSIILSASFAWQPLWTSESFNIFTWNWKALNTHPATHSHPGPSSPFFQLPRLPREQWRTATAHSTQSPVLCTWMWSEVM